MFEMVGRYFITALIYNIKQKSCYTTVCCFLVTLFNTILTAVKCTFSIFLNPPHQQDKALGLWAVSWDWVNCNTTAA